jgi:hypothetical protein
MSDPKKEMVLTVAESGSGGRLLAIYFPVPRDDRQTL